MALRSASLLSDLIICALMQCRVGLQAAGGQATATDEEAVPHRGQPLPPAALPAGGLHLHPQTQVQRGLEEACALETLVPVERRDSAPPPLPRLIHRIDVPVWLFSVFPVDSSSAHLAFLLS